MRLSITIILIVFSRVGFIQAEDDQTLTDSSQQVNKQKKAFSLDQTFKDPVTVNLYEDQEEDPEKVVEIKKKKRKKNVFYGIKTKKGFTKRTKGRDVIIEQFHLLKVYEEPNKYVPYKYYFNPKEKVIKRTNNMEPRKGYVLHGPYKKKVNNELVEEGIFYKGTKHARWVKYTKKFILRDKRYYYKGWPKDAEISYYDADETKVKEVIPIQYEKREGDYFYFFEDGKLAVQGKYENDVAVGLWKEYYPNLKKRKKEIQYAESPYNKQFKPYIKREWDADGSLIYEFEE